MLRRLRRTSGAGAVIETAKVEPGVNVVVFGLGGVGLDVDRRLEHGREDRHRRARQPIDRINDGFELMRKGESIRGGVTF
ncbi:MAG: hypothetical protein KF850_08125 [Labilithrix sp.]|nr:hypothetical protein [Labilithrix sp.]MBX3211984.1 hypothetical protein [Labilithrix sp.]